ncbi:uncharacterized protein LOC130727380 isoform X4 [Lotus japonicus]|uniref:uncharacterized protein LOC130727380 isoform X4 n=1 Tax=Lotus japonicus TaxID=34305 RepID=UPI002587324C|nr:uncharacterized protein LOC130727380 isoform X4 [Lotus japonicus]
MTKQSKQLKVAQHNTNLFKIWGNGATIVSVFRFTTMLSSSFRYVPPWLSQILACMGGCLGCFPKPISMDEASKGLITQGSAINNYDRSEDIWSSSSFYMDHSAGYSQRSFSSITIPNHPSDPQSSAGNQIDHPEEFVNHGLRLWKQTRKQWVGNKKTERRMQVGESRISWNATYESLLGTTRPFRQPIPLGEMVEFLVDIWELEGLV